VESSNLIRFGSRVTHTCFIRLPETADNAEGATRLGAALAGPEGKSDLRVSSTVDVNRRLGRAVGYFQFVPRFGLHGLPRAWPPGGRLSVPGASAAAGGGKSPFSSGSAPAAANACFCPWESLPLLGLGAACLATMLSQALLPLF
jgi:hypothetical protein